MRSIKLILTIVFISNFAFSGQVVVHRLNPAAQAAQAAQEWDLQINLLVFQIGQIQGSEPEEAEPLYLNLHQMSALVQMQNNILEAIRILDLIANLRRANGNFTQEAQIRELIAQFYRNLGQQNNEIFALEMAVIAHMDAGADEHAKLLQNRINDLRGTL